MHTNTASNPRPGKPRNPETRNGELGVVTCENGAAIDLAPLNGLWTQDQYLRLTEHTQVLIEFTDGCIEVLSMPTDRHQAISKFLFLALLPYEQKLGGALRYSPLRMRIRDGKFREPDLLFMCDANDGRRRNDFWLGADLVIEVVSPDDPDRDIRSKPQDYAEARILEYWVVDPMDETVTVLVLEDDNYTEHGRFRRGQRADSVLLSGFSVDVGEVFDDPMQSKTGPHTGG